MLSATEVIDTWLRSAAPAVIFDFNGTLSDDEPILFAVFSELFTARLGWTMSPGDYREHLLGRSDREIVEYAVARHGRGTDAEVTALMRLRQDRYRERVAEHSPITGDTVGLVRALSDNAIPLGIVTGAARGDVQAVLDGSPIGGRFDVLIAEEDVTVGKPDPEGFRTAIGQLRRRPDEVLVFEDSVPGVRAALAAGTHCIAVGRDPAPELRTLAHATVTALSADLVADALSRRPRAT